MSLFKLLLRMFNLLRNSKRSSCYHICRAWGVHFIWFIRLDNVQWFSLGKSERSDIAEISWYILYVYISDMLLISCCCVSAPTCWAEGCGVAAPGHPGSIGQGPQSVGGHLGCATVLCQSTGHREGTEGLKLLKCCDGGCCSSCATRCLGSLCVQTLEMLFFHQKMYHSSQQLGLDSEGKTGGGLWGCSVCELKRRWIFQKALTYLDGERPVQRILVAGGAVLSARLRC